MLVVLDLPILLIRSWIRFLLIIVPSPQSFIIGDLGFLRPNCFSFIGQKHLNQINNYYPLYQYKLGIIMSINIFQFLRQGTSLSRKSMETNKELEQKITPSHKTPNQLFFQTGKFTESADEDELNEQGRQWEGLDQNKMKHEHNKKIHKSAELRKKYHIKVQGTDVPFVFRDFTSLVHKYSIHKSLAAGLAEMGIQKPTPVQMQTIPALLEDRNVLVTAPTGTGKTLSYLLPILQNILKKRQQKLEKVPAKQEKNKKLAKKTNKVVKNTTYDSIECLIIAPQQELSTQIIGQLNSLAQSSVQVEKKPITTINHKCISELSEQEKQKIVAGQDFGVNILVATPQTFINLFGNEEGRMKLLAQIKYVVLDECDKYFQESFLDQIRTILEMLTTVKPKPVYGLFSATIQYPVEQLLKSQLLDDALRIQVGGKNKVLTSIDQSIQYCTNEYGKILQLKNMIAENRFIPPALIFVQEKIRAKQLFFELKKIMKNGPGGMDLSKKIQVLTGEKSKQERKQILEQFEKGVFLVLITTDIIARGIDFSHVNLVINYDFPNTMLTYIHRVGRTGRAERTGKAVTFFTEEDKPVVRSLANLLNASGCKVPEWILQMPNVDRKLKKKLQKFPTKRLPVGVSEGKDKNFEKELQKMQKVWQRKKERAAEKEEKEKAANGGEEEQSQWIQV